MRPSIFKTHIFGACLALSLSGCGSVGYCVYEPKVNGMTTPEGIDVVPVFQWRLSSNKNGTEQIAYRISVRDDEGKLCWDSGIVPGAEPFGILYEGDSLESNTSYTWTVESSDNQGRKTKSKPMTFSTGLLDRNEWTAEWIETTEPRKPLINENADIADLLYGKVKEVDPIEELDPAVYFRKEFPAPKSVKRAVAYATAHGVYNLYINGEKVSEILAPGFTSYPHYLEYQRYDITPFIKKGINVLGAVVADGWWSGKISNTALGNQYGDSNGLLCQLIIDYSDGTTDTIVTDKDFKWSNDGAFRYSDIFEGEFYDASKDLAGWDAPGFDDSQWKPVKVAEYDDSVLAGRRAEPVRVTRAVKAKKILVTPNGETVVDFGENIVGRVVSRIRGRKNQMVTFIHQESLGKDGNIHLGIFRPDKHQRDRYRFGADGEASFTPQFTFKGFRYVLVEGLDYQPSAEDFTAEVLGTDMERTGDFAASDTLLTQLQSNIVRSQAGNMLSIPTDCPHREKAGWTGDMMIYAATAAYNMDVDAFLGKWLTGMRYDQGEDGGIPDVTPMMPKFPSQMYSAGWSDASVVVPWRMYECYGDDRILKDNWAMMTRWADYLVKSSPNGVREDGKFQYGDWALPKVPEKYKELSGPGFCFLGSGLVADAYLVNTFDIMSKAAYALGKDEESASYKALAAESRKAFGKKYIDSKGELELDMQGLYVLTLAFDLVSEDLRPLTERKLLSIMRDEYDDHLNTGFLSTPFLMDVLLSIDKDYAMKVLFQKDAPSWLYEVKMGATTMWEDWFAVKPDGEVIGSSLNHFAYGCVGDFLYRKVLGLECGAPAFRKIIVDPVYPKSLTWAEGCHETPYGRAEVRWDRTEQGISLKVTVPPGCEAEINDGTSMRKVQSGRYTFVIDSL